MKSDLIVLQMPRVTKSPQTHPAVRVDDDLRDATVVAAHPEPPVEREKFCFGGNFLKNCSKTQ